MMQRVSAARRPSWRYWIGVILASRCSWLGVVLAAFGVDRGSLLTPGLVLVGVLTAVAIRRERRVRAMPSRARTTWVVVGLLLGAAVAALGLVIAFFVAFSIECGGGTC